MGLYLQFPKQTMLFVPLCLVKTVALQGILFSEQLLMIQDSSEDFSDSPPHPHMSPPPRQSSVSLILSSVPPQTSLSQLYCGMNPCCTITVNTYSCGLLVVSSWALKTFYIFDFLRSNMILTHGQVQSIFADWMRLKDLNIKIVTLYLDSSLNSAVLMFRDL